MSREAVLDNFTLDDDIIINPLDTYSIKKRNITVKMNYTYDWVIFQTFANLLYIISRGGIFVYISYQLYTLVCIVLSREAGLITEKHFYRYMPVNKDLRLLETESYFILQNPTNDSILIEEGEELIKIRTSGDMVIHDISYSSKV